MVSAPIITAKLATGGHTLDVDLQGILNLRSSRLVADRIRAGLKLHHTDILIDARKVLIAVDTIGMGMIFGEQVLASDDPILHRVALVVPRSVPYTAMRAYKGFVAKRGLQHLMTHQMSQALEWLDGSPCYLYVDDVL